MSRKGSNVTVIQRAYQTDQLAAPADLGETGAALWRSIQAQYAIGDSGGLAMLRTACESADRAQRCRERIDADGELLMIRGQPRDHPLLRHETAARSLMVRTLLRLGLDVEPLQRPGRPSGGAR